MHSSPTNPNVFRISQCPLTLSHLKTESNQKRFPTQTDRQSEFTDHDGVTASCTNANSARA